MSKKIKFYFEDDYLPPEYPIVNPPQVQDPVTDFHAIDLFEEHCVRARIIEPEKDTGEWRAINQPKVSPLEILDWPHGAPPFVYGTYFCHGDYNRRGVYPTYSVIEAVILQNPQGYFRCMMQTLGRYAGFSIAGHPAFEGDVFYDMERGLVACLKRNTDGRIYFQYADKCVDIHPMLGLRKAHSFVRIGTDWEFQQKLITYADIENTISKALNRFSTEDTASMLDEICGNNTDAIYQSEYFLYLQGEYAAEVNAINHVLLEAIDPSAVTDKFHSLYGSLETSEPPELVKSAIDECRSAYEELCDAVSPKSFGVDEVMIPLHSDADLNVAEEPECPDQKPDCNSIHLDEDEGVQDPASDDDSCQDQTEATAEDSTVSSAPADNQGKATPEADMIEKLVSAVRNAYEEAKAVDKVCEITGISEGLASSILIAEGILEHDEYGIHEKLMSGLSPEAIERETQLPVAFIEAFQPFDRSAFHSSLLLRHARPWLADIVADVYSGCQSERRTAAMCCISGETVHRILIYKGMVPEDPYGIIDLYRQGISVEEIADRLQRTVRYVRRYLPLEMPEK